MSDTPRLTRYEKVKQILDRAAVSSSVDYNGLGPFWQLPLNQFLQLELYGVRMIAAADEAPIPSCCHGPGSESPVKTRSARSGLIQGLRGQSPFDGTEFPPLPWGGQRVAAEEITFIADWIDDNCPAMDYQVSLNVEPLTATASIEQLSQADVDELTRAFAVYEASASAYTYKYGEVKQRMNLDCLGEPQIEQLRWAFRELYRFNKWPEDRRSYNNVALVHQNHCQHGWERFLPWHRIYLYEFEQALQDVCPDVTLPYWDWTMPHYRPECPEKGWLIPMALQAFLTDASITFLEDADPPLPPDAAATLRRDMVGKHYASQHRFFDEVARLIGV